MDGCDVGSVVDWLDRWVDSVWIQYHLRNDELHDEEYENEMPRTVYIVSDIPHPISVQLIPRAQTNTGCGKDHPRSDVEC